MHLSHTNSMVEAKTLVADPTAPSIMRTVPCSRHTPSFSQQTLSPPRPCQPVAAHKQPDMRFRCAADKRLCLTRASDVLQTNISA